MGYSQICATAHELETATICWRAEHSYYAEVDKQHLDEQGDLIDQIIDHAFDTLDARHLDLRIVDPQRSMRRAA
jgi:hypothetical protein